MVEAGHSQENQARAMVIVKYPLSSRRLGTAWVSLAA